MIKIISTVLLLALGIFVSTPSRAMDISEEEGQGSQAAASSSAAAASHASSHPLTADYSDPETESDIEHEEISVAPQSESEEDSSNASVSAGGGRKRGTKRKADPSSSSEEEASPNDTREEEVAQARAAYAQVRENASTIAQDARKKARATAQIRNPQDLTPLIGKTIGGLHFTKKTMLLWSWIQTQDAPFKQVEARKGTNLLERAVSRITKKLVDYKWLERCGDGWYQVTKTIQSPDFPRAPAAASSAASSSLAADSGNREEQGGTSNFAELQTSIQKTTTFLTGKTIEDCEAVKRQKKMWLWMQENGTFSQAELVEVTGYSRGNVTKIVRKMQRDKKLERVGRHKATRYRVVIPQGELAAAAASSSAAASYGGAFSSAASASEKIDFEREIQNP